MDYNLLFPQGNGASLTLSAPEYEGIYSLFPVYGVGGVGSVGERMDLGDDGLGDDGLGGFADQRRQQQRFDSDESDPRRENDEAETKGGLTAAAPPPSAFLPMPPAHAVPSNGPPPLATSAPGRVEYVPLRQPPAQQPQQPPQPPRRRRPPLHRAPASSPRLPSSTPSISLPITAPAARPERRNHNKSRQGCFNCKRRRIKCQEVRPVCGHCAKTGLQCAYPEVPRVNHQPADQIPLFSLQDMRFFQHFLGTQTKGGHGVFPSEVCPLSHRYDFLMHALLGLAAADLMQHDASPALVTAAMDHRLKAVRAVKRALAAAAKWGPGPAASAAPAAHAARAGSGSGGDGSGGESSPTTTMTTTKMTRRGGSKMTTRQNTASASPASSSSAASSTSSSAVSPPTPPSTATTTTSLFEEGNALVATCLALALQSVALADGLAEYMTFVRGILHVAGHMHGAGVRLLFTDMLGGSIRAQPNRTTAENTDTDHRAAAAAAAAAVRQLEPLCAGDALAMVYQARVLAVAEGLQVSPEEALAAVARQYAWWMQLPHAQFCQVIDVDHRPVYALLAAHWIALKALLEVQEEQQQQPTGMALWLAHLNGKVAPTYRAYNAWPVAVEAQRRGVIGR